MKDLETIAQLLLSQEQSNKDIGLFLIKSQNIDIDSLANHLSRLAFAITRTYLKNIKWNNNLHFEIDHHHIYAGDADVLLYMKTVRTDYHRLELRVYLEIWRNGDMIMESELKTLDRFKILYRVINKFSQESIENLKTL